MIPNSEQAWLDPAKMPPRELQLRVALTGLGQGAPGMGRGGWGGTGSQVFSIRARGEE